MSRLLARASFYSGAGDRTFAPSPDICPCTHENYYRKDLGGVA